jgi:hypothetical protein
MLWIGHSFRMPPYPDPRNGICEPLFIISFMASGAAM